jgi:hypothetical protein
MTLLESALESLWASLATASEVSVTYRRGGISVQLAAIPGRSQTEVDSGDGYVRSMQLNDFIVKRAELGLTPQPGDRIEWQGRYFDVVHLAGERHYESVGPWSVLYRVHTREVANG